MAVKDGKDMLITQLRLNQLTELDKHIKDAENRVNAISRLLTELYEKKFQGKLSDSEFRIQSRALSCEKEELLQFLSDVTVRKSTISKKFLSVTEILNRIENYRLSELDAVTQEICDALIEKIVIDEPMGQKEKNYGKRIVDIYIYELGNLSELVDVRFKPYSQRIKEIAPQLLLERRCDTANVVEALATKRTSLKKPINIGRFRIAEQRIDFFYGKPLFNGINQNLFAYFNNYSLKVCFFFCKRFAKRFFGMSFNDFYCKTRKEI